MKALAGTDPSVSRGRASTLWLVAALVITVWFVCRLPWWGISWIAHDWPPILVGRILQNADLAGALLALWLLAWASAREPTDAEADAVARAVERSAAPGKVERRAASEAG